MIGSMIDVKQAVSISRVFMASLLEPGRAEDLRLEEIQTSEDERSWLVTISLPAPVPKSMAAALSFSDREYKLLTVDGFTGEVRSMTIRKV